MSSMKMVSAVPDGPDRYKLKYDGASCDIILNNGLYHHSGVTGMKSYLNPRKTMEECYTQLKQCVDRERE